jgi:hypothetical protein
MCKGDIIIVELADGGKRRFEITDAPNSNAREQNW